MIGPDAEYLEGSHWVSGNADQMKIRLRRALERWEVLRKEKSYANETVPPIDNFAPPEIEGKPLVFRVFLRDLPRSADDDSGRRFSANDHGRDWMSFTDWAWNVNWLAFDDAEVFVPSGDDESTVEPTTVKRICREVLVDNVRGQTGRWRDSDLKEATLTMKKLAADDRGIEIEYRGQARMESNTASYSPTLYGRATYDKESGRFTRFRLLAIGDRSGHGTFNQRIRDQEAAPMGIALDLFTREGSVSDATKDAHETR